MRADNFSLQNYFGRIGFHGEAKADIATIAEIMRCQLHSVPFENLDVQAGKIVSLVPEEIVEKIVDRHRGGYCYEVNGLFSMMLEALGVPFQLVAARPMTYPVKKPKTHMAIVLALDNEQWLCDLGFGGYGIRAPMRLDLLDVEIKQDFDTYIISKINDREYLLKTIVDGEWMNLYGFDLSPQEWIDFVPANYLNSTHPESIFVQRFLVVLQDKSGRKILIDDTLKTMRNGRTEKEIVKPEERVAILSEHFGLRT
jgi:N-hydroxyarylamine O-acetyltransferase